MSSVFVRHEIVHNKHVVEDLKAKGARFVDEIDEIPQGAVTIFSAHGVSKSVQTAAKSRNLPVIDATCPLVTKVHLQGKKYLAHGRIIILVGHAGHPEVEGTMGQIPGPVYLVQTEDDVKALPLAKDTPVAYVTQTTLSIDDTRGVIEALKRHFSDVVGPETNDICYATQNRQTAVRELTKIADVILVVGAKNSSNSNRLREIGEEAGVPSYLLADGSELEARLGEGCQGYRPYRGRVRTRSHGAGCHRSASDIGPDRSDKFTRGSGKRGVQASRRASLPFDFNAYTFKSTGMNVRTN